VFAWSGGRGRFAVPDGNEGRGAGGESAAEPAVAGADAAGGSSLRLSVGDLRRFAYSHFDAGPKLLQGANLAVRRADCAGAGDAVGRGRECARILRDDGRLAELRKLFGKRVECGSITGPFVSEHMFLVGPEYRLKANEHAAMMLHAFVGGAYGNFTSALGGVNPQSLGLFPNQFTVAAHLGIDRSEPVAEAGVSDRAGCNDDGLWAQRVRGAVRDFCGIVYRMGRQFKR